jgi:alpha-glucosidase (family GH31 glycosyl hydrolase)
MFLKIFIVMKRNSFYVTISTLLFLLLSCSVFQDTDKKLVLSDGSYKLEVDTKNLKLRFYDSKGKLIVPSDSIAGLYLNESPIVNSEVITNSSLEIVLDVVSAKEEKAKVNLTFEKEFARITVSPADNHSKISLRFGGMPVAHGLGDAGGWNNTFDLAEKEEKTYVIANDGGRKRWLSTFNIFPRNNFAGVFFDRGKKSVILSENTYQLNTEIDGKSTFYFFTGEPKDIYSNYKKVRNDLGYEDIKPKSRLFEVGWESWDALGWNTNQFTVKNILSRFLDKGYQIRWAVTGSGFWDEGGTTTSFGRFGEKFPDTDVFKSWMHQHDIYWMIGLRTNLIPSGGPYYPATEKRDKNLKVRSYYGNTLSDEALAKNLLLTDGDGKPRLITSRIFPIVPCYIIDGNKPGAASWFRKNYTKWNVDGIKEDTMMDLEEETSIFNKPIAKIATEGGHVIARCGEFSAPGTLLRINDTDVWAMQDRTIINYLQYAASGMPNVYSDVCGIHNMHNRNAVDANIRHAWLLSLTSGMALGAFPSEWTEKEQTTFKKAVDFHSSLVPYLYSAGMKSYKTGFPYTLTPMSIAFAEDEQAVNFEEFQWMIGESILAAPLLKSYKNGMKDIYLPKGTWYDWETNEKFTGPIQLENFHIPLNKVPCFVGGKGVVVVRNNSNGLVIRVYKVNRKNVAEFYSVKDDERYQVNVTALDFDNVSVLNKTTGELVIFSRNEAYIEFPIIEGHHYEVK